MSRWISVSNLKENRDEKLLNNPDRGFYFEIEYDVFRDSTMYTDDKAGVYGDLNKKLELYGADKPKLVKTYIHLNGYKGVALDEVAINRINSLFDAVQEKGLKAIVSFVYQYDIDGVEEDGEIKYVGSQGKGQVDAQTVFTHIKQLKSVFERNKKVISIVQMGFVGAWGEWSLYDERVFTEDVRRQIIIELSKSVPKEIKLAVRYPMIKTKLIDAKNKELYNRVGFHCDAIFGTLDGNNWGSTNWDKGNEQWTVAVNESPKVPVLGELFWGWWFDNMKFSLDGHDCVEQFVTNHYYSFNITHSYLEGDRPREYLPLYRWKSTLVSKRFLEDHNYPFAEKYFEDENSQPKNRTIFEYLRDHLGYRISIEKYWLSVKRNVFNVKVKLKNSGFALPFNIQGGFALINKKGEVVKEFPCNKTEDWGKCFKIDKDVSYCQLGLKHNYIEGCKVAFYLRNSAKEYAVFDSDLEIINGMAILPFKENRC